jgi:hypothetical protein
VTTPRLVLCAAVVAALWAGLALLAPRPDTPPPTADAPPPAESRERHYVSAPELVAAGTAPGRGVGPLPVPAGRPAAVVFVKAGCPCSVETEPLWHYLAARHPGIAFLAVIDASESDARDYAAARRVPYPVLPDPELAVVRRFGAWNGAYVALVRPDGTLDSLWPGFSAEATPQLDRRLAELAGPPAGPWQPPVALPGPLTTGCPFDPGTRPEESASWPSRSAAATR